MISVMMIVMIKLKMTFIVPPLKKRKKEETYTRRTQPKKKEKFRLMILNFRMKKIKIKI